MSSQTVMHENLVGVRVQQLGAHISQKLVLESSFQFSLTFFIFHLSYSKNNMMLTKIKCSNLISIILTAAGFQLFQPPILLAF